MCNRGVIVVVCAFVSVSLSPSLSLCVLRWCTPSANTMQLLTTEFSGANMAETPRQRRDRRNRAIAVGLARFAMRCTQQQQQQQQQQ